MKALSIWQRKGPRSITEFYNTIKTARENGYLAQCLLWLYQTYLLEE